MVNGESLNSPDWSADIKKKLAEADCLIADISEIEPDIFIDIGQAKNMNKPVLITGQGILPGRQLDPFNYIEYTDDEHGYISLHHRLFQNLIVIRNLAKSETTQFDAIKTPFYIDWDNIEPRAAENLIKELLSQLGFRNTEWLKGFHEIELIAELPKNDPDGYKYSEMWLISMNEIYPLILLDTLRTDPDYLLSRLQKYSGFSFFPAANSVDVAITVLLISFRRGSPTKLFENRLDDSGKSLLRKRSGGLNIRFRLWDREYLTSLVIKYPHLGYKYFSNEASKLSKTRKSMEELYKENVVLLNQQTLLNNQLNEEKSKRISAERDAIWKDISFSAAHKIGNPIFAIETDLEPLRKRIKEQKTDDAMDVINNIHSALEKAKAFVEQFKSLTKAQEIKQEPFQLKPLLDGACNCVINKNINCIVECPEDVEVFGDPQRLSECFDELVINAAHWIQKEKKEKTGQISFSVSDCDNAPDFLDSSRKYMIIHIRDNGPGIPNKDKDRIFDAFFTRRSQGSGLGLALVRRIIEGHEGSIHEKGEPGQGAYFEIFLPVKRPHSNVLPKKGKLNE